MSIEIGTVTLVEDTDLTQLYETAAWYQIVRVKAGHESRIYARGYLINHNPQHPEGVPLGAVCGFEGSDFWWNGGTGEIIDSDFSPLFGGVAVMSNRGRDNGKQAQAATVQPFQWTVAEAIALHGGRMGPWQITLDEGFTIRSREIDTQVWDEAALKYVPAKRLHYGIVPVRVAINTEVF